ncbi:phosphonatase-like hydrolase [Okibacterium sp. HSC-33S16]|uniref:HAD family hydrolase n=1 Tax=Okibacterium sp. HSC-33S16 TaxID=2910965 RepID=UPI00209EA80D|nr:HAD family hydrolase [Okibacterium sp. HSC-33S16]MCP2031471.1 phosphonatase-like hydrolase [Okibacterium sp. HSC-33S16]
MTTFDDIVVDHGDTRLSFVSDPETIEVELVVLDVTGTTVDDDVIVERAFVTAVKRTGIASTSEELDAAVGRLHATRGQSKLDVFRALADDDDSAERALDGFDDAYAEIVGAEGIAAMPGAEDLLHALRESGVKVALATDLSRRTCDVLLDTLRWKDLVDATVSPSEAGRGRPFPDLPLTALIRTSVSRVDAVVVVGDTTNDMLSGIAAGAGLVVGVLTGAHDEVALRDAGADDVLDSVADLSELLGLDES